MAALLIVAVGGMLWLMALSRNGGRVRDAFAWAFVGMFGLVAWLTEGLSLAHAVAGPAVMTAWGLAALGLGLVSRPWRILRNGQVAVPNFSFVEKALLFAVVANVLVLLLIALAAPPTTSDAYAYHLPRVYNWIRQCSVQFYPTADWRQNVYQPLAEFAILHLRLLTGSDRLFNLVQWSGLVASLVFVSLLAQDIGLKRNGQLLAVCLAVTIPMVVLQATSCQTDLIAASFCLALTYGLIRFIATDTVRSAAFCGLALGTALLCKGTSYIFCLPLLGVFGLFHLMVHHRHGVTRIVRCWLIMAGIALTINAGFYARNLGAYGHPLGVAQSQVSNIDHSWHQIQGNVIRNVASHLGAPFPSWNSSVARLTNRLAGPGALFGDMPFSVTFLLFEDDTGNLPQLLLAGLCLMLVPWLNGPRKRLMLALLAAVFFAAFGVCTLLFWQPWITRFHTFLFLLLTPIFAWVLQRNRRLSLIVASGVWCYALPFLLLNVSRPVISLTVMQAYAPESLRPLLRYRPSVFLAPRMSQCFGSHVDEKNECEAAMRWLPLDPKVVSGVLSGASVPEFYLWLVAEQALGGQLPCLVPVTTPAGGSPSSSAPAIVFDSRDRSSRRVLRGYHPVFKGRFITVWKRTDDHRA